MSDTKLSIAVVGAGGVGGYFGACLARAGHDVTFIARGDHLAAIRADGLLIEGAEAPFHVRTEATDDPATVGPVDLLLVCVKLWDTEAAAAASPPLVGPETSIASLQNGIDAEAMLARTFGSERVLGGVAGISAWIKAPGRIEKLGGFQQIRIGELGGGRSERLERLGRHLDQPGIDLVIEDDITAAIWNKFVFLTGISALTALTRRPIGDVRTDPDTRALLQQVVGEARALGRARGVTVRSVDETMAAIDGLPPTMFASMAGDLLAGRHLELPWLSGRVAQLGEQHGIPTPANHFVTTALKLHAAGT